MDKNIDLRDSVRNSRGKYVRLKEGARLYHMCAQKFAKLATDARAIHKVNKVTLVNCETFEQYLETFRIVE